MIAPVADKALADICRAEGTPAIQDAPRSSCQRPVTAIIFVIRAFSACMVYALSAY